MSSNQKVFSPANEVKWLGTELASGGEGRVYPLQDNPNILVKWYHPEVLQKRGKELQEKIECMSTLKPAFSQTAVSWPSISVFDEKKNWIGYAMRRAEGVPLARLAHPMTYQKYFPNLDRVGIVNYLLSLLEALHSLHQKQVMVGDYNLNNILCTPGTNQITLIDCDSYQIQHNGKFYPCPVGSPDMTAKEQHGQAFSKVQRTEQSEWFSVAIVLFKCLMPGRHPYDIIGGEDPVSNLQSGRFAYGIGNTGVPTGAWFNIWSHMPYTLKNMFITTFTKGANDPNSRPSLLDWKNALKLYASEMKKGWHEMAIIPSKPKPKAYRGSRELVTN